MFLLLACTAPPSSEALVRAGFHATGRHLPEVDVDVRLRGWGRAGSLEAPSEGSAGWADGAPLGWSDRVVAAERGGLVEWWAPVPFGWEHGYTIASQPAGEGALRLEVAFDGASGLEVEATGASAEVGDGRVLEYQGLVAWDAEGRALDAAMEPTRDGLALVVDDADAVYPIVVDPVLSVAQTLSIGGLGAFSGGGDLNADGYDDVVALDTTTGRINWWLGGSAGVVSTPSGAVLTSLPSGAPIDGVGDFNGDGFADVIAGDSSYNSSRGAVYVFYGRSGGLRPVYGRRIPGASAGAGLGASVGGVGDTNGDGLADIGAWSTQMTAHVWQGRPNGVVLPAPVAVSTGYDASYYDVLTPGNITGLGDVNGDGYGEVGVGYPESDLYSGEAYWYYGSASGVVATGGGGFDGTDNHTIDTWCGESYRGTTGMGSDVVALGDIDQDGYDDFSLTQSYEACIGYDYVGYGGSAGPSGSLGAWPSFYGTGYTETVGAGDFNGDGWGDLAGGFTQLGVAVGSAARFSGTSTYTPLATTWTTYLLDTVGDLDADGCDDLLVYVGSVGLRVYEGCPSDVYDEEVPVEDPVE